MSLNHFVSFFNNFLYIFVFCSPRSNLLLQDIPSYFLPYLLTRVPFFLSSLPLFHLSPLPVTLLIPLPSLMLFSPSLNWSPFLALSLHSHLPSSSSYPSLPSPSFSLAPKVPVSAILLGANMAALCPLTT